MNKSIACRAILTRYRYPRLIPNNQIFTNLPDKLGTSPDYTMNYTNFTNRSKIFWLKKCFKGKSYYTIMINNTIVVYFSSYHLTITPKPIKTKQLRRKKTFLK